MEAAGTQRKNAERGTEANDSVAPAEQGNSRVIARPSSIAGKEQRKLPDI